MVIPKSVEDKFLGKTSDDSFNLLDVIADVENKEKHEQEELSALNRGFVTFRKLIDDSVTNPTTLTSSTGVGWKFEDGHCEIITAKLPQPFWVVITEQLLCPVEGTYQLLFIDFKTIVTLMIEMDGNVVDWSDKVVESTIKKEKI